MDISGHDILGLDVYLIIHVSRQLTEDDMVTIKGGLEAWSSVVSTGAFKGPLHNSTVPEYNNKNLCVYIEVDMGSMDPEQGIGLLDKICTGCNEFIFKEELITSIEITSEPDMNL